MEMSAHVTGESTFFPLRCAEVRVYDENENPIGFLSFDTPTGAYAENGRYQRIEVTGPSDWSEETWRSIRYASVYYTEPTCRPGDTGCAATQTRARRRVGAEYQYFAEAFDSVVTDSGAVNPTTQTYSVAGGGPNCSYTTPAP